MENTSSRKSLLSERDIYYFRQRTKTRIFQSVVSYFAAEAERRGLTKKEIAERLGKDPAQITRWLAGPGNWTLDTISDLLLAMEGELLCFVQGLDQSSAAEHPSTAGRTTSSPPVAQILDAVQKIQQRRSAGHGLVQSGDVDLKQTQAGSILSIVGRLDQLGNSYQGYANRSTQPNSSAAAEAMAQGQKQEKRTEISTR